MGRKAVKLNEGKRLLALKTYHEFKDELDIDIAIKGRGGLLPAYRSLFNTIAFNKHKIGVTDIARVYVELGLYMCHANVLHSLKTFNKYCAKNSELMDLYEVINPIRPPALCKLIDSIPKDKEAEIQQLIELRIKSWNWKRKDTITEYKSY
mgnify:FL=1